ncbi:unnamed protein product (macronuclear) [Paramecium tetraurelia]|uniref:Uncharacterized protein n=1 Tax=Paramecium tetraurelia TaxID=5888 RepID=A0EDA2_PARTE|nr:uncharacterized protein GSPATT00004138001 [Paramecium tetraurelia]CAK93269.1 unnamed protein product [Paramecium tetraurelia]|eukprot:XP_001460666.1 hypothetical protein (macronuclear) [Paramecium tetraurelia strain d4-2]
MRNKKKALTKEEIQFYTQRRLQYTQDFLKMSQQFDPKLKYLTRLLIARKQMMNSKNNQAMPQSRKCNKVFASMTKSSEIQKKIDQGMIAESCKYSLEPMPKCNFGYSEICSRIQTSMVPIVEKLDKNIQQKLDTQHHHFDSENKTKKKQLIRSDTFYNEDQKPEEYIDSMQIKSQRLHNIITSISILQRTKAYQEYNQRKSLHHRPIHLQMCSNDISEQLSEEEDQEGSFSNQDYERLIKFERMKLKEQFEQDKIKSQRLEQYVQTSLQKLGLQKKMFSMKELQEFIKQCQTQTTNVVNEYKTERQEFKNRKSQLLSSLLSTKNNTYSNTQSRYKNIYSDTKMSDENRFSFILKQQQK